ncbi:capsular biosynthesis protein, partial [Staphylococcus arlettae]|uniref:tyrosine-protein phosphatase n=1 Tax=Staphylococcus arlettae TaxID=29378 RepID=UPI000E68D70E
VISICLPIYPGQEIRISDKILTDIKNNQIIGLNYSKYLLIEFPSNEIPHYSQQLFFELQLQQFIPIIAHPERNNVFLKQSDTLYYLIKNGALSQLTIASVLGKLGKKIQKFALQLIDHNLTHFIASDAHHYCYRPFENNQLYQNTKLKHYAAEITQMLKNSQCIIKDESILKKQPLKIDKRFLKLF